MRYKRTVCLLIAIVMLLTACNSQEDRVAVDNTSKTTSESATQLPEIEEEIKEEIKEETKEETTSMTMENMEEYVTMDEHNMPAAVKTEKLKGVYGELVNIEYPSTTVGNTRKAIVLLPPDYDSQKAYPVLYLLHGIGGDQSEWMYGNPKAILGNMIAEGLAKPMIAVFPNVRAREEDSANPSDIFTKEHFQAFDNFINDLETDLMPYIKENYNVLEGRENTAIAGLSMGGRESLYIGLTLQENFGYIGAFSPAFGLLPYTNMNVIEEGLLKEDGFVLNEGYEDTLIMIATGDNDGVVRDEPYKYHMALEKNDVPHIYYEVPGGHDMNVWTNGLYYFAQELFK